MNEEHLRETSSGGQLSIIQQEDSQQCGEGKQRETQIRGG